jgi:ubiquinone/menaquinone biosynthesis C-methylase UbiE
MSKIGDIIFFRNHHVCPRWLCFTFDNWFRRLLQNPDAIMKTHIREGDTVLDIGPGMGFFTIPIAHLVGDDGQVIAADIQEEMLAAISERAIHAGLQNRIKLQLCKPDSLGVSCKVDFILAFWMVHEVPNQQKFFAELYSLLKDKGKFLMVEPKIHVTHQKFADAVQAAQNAGFKLAASPTISLSISALLKKSTT